MPKKMEEALRKEAKKKFPGNEKRQDKYVYGTLRRNTSWEPKQQKKGKK